ncbi:MAG: CHAP domain-containing protein [Chloroflexaceae bacterium]|nr:CHAP domain-containing protein [Chloroflexaceae bacterium]
MLTAIILLMSGLFISSVPVKTVSGQSLQSAWCQCVIYILNRFNDGRPLGNSDGRYNHAYQLDRPDPDGNIWMELIAGGSFHRTNDPHAGGVLVIQRGVAGMSSTSGHIAVIDSVQSSGDNWIIAMRGSNQGGSVGEDWGCTNVSVVTITLSKSESGVSYWSQGNDTDPNPPPDDPGPNPPPDDPDPCPVPT